MEDHIDLYDYTSLAPFELVISFLYFILASGEMYQEKQGQGSIIVQQDQTLT